MSIQLLGIVLFSHDGRTRVVPLRAGQVNVITGGSRTGKSALIDIVDYCFGAGELRVPEGPIRRSVSWFGLHLKLKKGEAFIARRTPEPAGQSNEQCFVQIGETVKVPEFSELRQTTNTKGLMGLLTGWCGIEENIHEPPEGHSRLPLAANIRHALALSFQSQNELTRKEQLFHVYDPDPRKQGHKFQSVQDTLPYFLGAVDDDFVRKLALHRKLLDELRNCERRLGEYAAVRGEGMTRALTLLSQARDVGLTSSNSSDYTEVIEALRAAASRPSSMQPVEVQTNQEFARLSDERDALQREYRRIQAEITSVRSYKQQESGFAQEVSEQQARLRSIGIFEGTPPSSQCPLCTQNLPDKVAPPRVSEIKNTFSAMANRLAAVSRSEPHVEKLLGELDGRLQKLNRALTLNRTQLEAVRSKDEALLRESDEATQRALIIGRISLYLESLPELPDSSSLDEKAKGLRVQISALDQELSAEAIQEKLDSILSIISRKLTAFGQDLELEHAKFPLRLDMKKLTVVADTGDGPVPMDRMGSGENWVGHHLVAHLALHHWFVQKGRPVPRFLFLDQPSQSQFPAEKDTAEGSMSVVPDDDRAVVARMFRQVFNVVKELSPEFQVILLEHADLRDKWFQDAVRQRWRGPKEKLVPDDWPRV